MTEALPQPAVALDQATAEASTVKSADVFDRSGSSTRQSETAQSSSDMGGVHAAPTGRVTAVAPAAVPPAPFVQPLYISKVNTVLQLSLIAGCIGQSWYGWPTAEALWALGGLTGLTTVGSFGAYVRAYQQGKLLR